MSKKPLLQIAAECVYHQAFVISFEHVATTKTN
jgi:hypothetical protein